MIRSTRHTALLLLTLTVLGAGQAGAEDRWAGFRGDGTGRAEGVLSAGDGPTRLVLRWKHALGSGYSGVAVAEGTLVTLANAGTQDVVVALDPATGAERWHRNLGPAYVGHDGSATGPIATPAIADGRVVALSPWGQLAAFTLESGEPIWTTHLTNDLGSEKPFYGFGGSPLVVGGTLVLQIGKPTKESSEGSSAESEDQPDEGEPQGEARAGAIAGFDVATGALRWRSVDDGVFTQSPIVVELAGQRQVVALCAKTLVGLDPASGRVLWSFEHGAGSDKIMGVHTASPVAVGDDRLLIKQDSEASVLLRVEAAEDGFTVTRIHEAGAFTRSYSPPTYWGGQAYGYTARFLSALDLDSGALLWRAREPGDGFVTSVDGYLAVLTKEGSVHLGAASPEGWQESARLDLFDDLAWTPPSVGDGALYLRSLGEIARVDLVRADVAAGSMEVAAGGVGAGAKLPEALAPLVRALVDAPDPQGVVDHFLAARSLPLIAGDEVVFVWRGPAEDVAVAGDMIGARREERMHRLPGTDLWWWSTSLDPHARVAYLFFVDYAPRVDPSHERRTFSTILGPDMNWLRGDPLEMSWFAMPEWPGRLASSASESPAAAGRIEELKLTLQPPGEPVPEPVEAVAHIWLPPGYDEGTERYPVAFVHSPVAREMAGWPGTLDRVVGRRVAPLIVVFVDAPEMRGYEDIFVPQIVAPVDLQYRTSRERDARANVAMGFQSVPTTLIALQHRDSFGVLVIQSFFVLDSGYTPIENALAEITGAENPLRVYLEWGRWDLRGPHENWDLRLSAVEFHKALAERGWQVAGGEVWDSTDIGSWRNRTGTLLETIFPLSEAQPSRPSLAEWLTEP
jgi:outer membrane protein assembly factor BamB